MLKMDLEDFKKSVHSQKYAYRQGTDLYNHNGRKIGRITPENQVILQIPS